MRRLVITGLPCPKSAWENFLGPSKDQRIIPMQEVFANTQSCDPREMSRFITEQIRKERPSSLLCHDMGVPLTLLSLLRLNKMGECLQTRVTLFNGAFRRINLLKANHPFRIQFMRDATAIKEVKANGGAIDEGLRQYLPRIRAMYRLIILYGTTERLTSWVGLNDFAGFSEKNPLSCPIQIIASKNDPYIPFDSILQLKEDTRASALHLLNYGHFPYNGNREETLRLINAFEAQDSPLIPPRPQPSESSRMLL